ncbi:hypothetical protein [Lactococcus muris]|uniref:hypothetical protein n=1 Tax=Lactococcus muris TaxID=2941330 RepID=UPI002300A880
MALHTYEFYKNRKHNPKWRDAYIKFRNRRIIGFIISFTVLAMVIIGIGLFLNYSSERNLTANDINFETIVDFFNYCVDAYKRAFDIAINKISSLL